MTGYDDRLRALTAILHFASKHVARWSDGVRFAADGP